MCERADLCEGRVVYPTPYNGDYTCGINKTYFSVMATNGVPISKILNDSCVELLYIAANGTISKFLYPIAYINLSPPQKNQPDTSYRTDMFGFKTSDKNWNRGLNLV